MEKGALLKYLQFEARNKQAISMSDDAGRVDYAAGRVEF